MFIVYCLQKMHNFLDLVVMTYIQYTYYIYHCIWYKIYIMYRIIGIQTMTLDLDFILYAIQQYSWVLRIKSLWKNCRLFPPKSI